MRRIITIWACAIFVCGFAPNIGAQDAKPVSSPSQFTAEQQASLDEALELSRQVLQLHEQRKFDAALPLAQRVVELRRRAFGENHRTVADAISNVGELYFAKQQYDEAEMQFRKALSIYEKDTAHTTRMARVVDTLTILRWVARDYNKAEQYGNRALDLKTELYGEQSVQFFISIDNLLKVYESANKTSQRNALYARALAVVEKTKDRIPDRLALFRYHCGLRKGKQTAEVSAMMRQIESLLSWNPSQQTVLPEGVLNGRALVLVRPPYPDEARAANASGTVIVQVEIDECGSVTKAKATSGPVALRRVSEAAALEAKFSPTYISGMPVSVTGVIHYNFINQPPPRK